MGWGRGRGRGWGAGAWGYGPAAAPYAYGPYAAAPYAAPVSQEQELASLQAQADYFGGALDEIRKRIAELESAKSKD
jgi:hypothetical protein